MKNILLLGGNGFIGRNVLSYIDEHLAGQYKVIVFDLQNSISLDFKFNCVEKVYNENFEDSAAIKNVFKENKIDLVIHLISATVPVTSQNFRFDIEANLLPSIDLFNIMAEANVKKIIYLSSGGAIYGKNSSNENIEIAEHFPSSSYGIMKLTIEKYLYLFNIKYDCEALIIRLTNPYGPYHFSMKQGIINVAMQKAFKKEPITIWGDGENLKDYIYIEDFVDILFKLLPVHSGFKIINIGSQKIHSTNTILQMINQIFPDFSWKYQSAEITDVPLVNVNTEKLKELVGDYLFTDLKNGIEKTYKWMLDNYSYYS